MSESSTGWSGPHRALGLTPACGHAAMAEHINPQILMIWLQKRAAQATDSVVADHLERSRRWLEKALIAECEGTTKGPGTLSRPPSRGGL